MSYNIDSIVIVASDGFLIDRETLLALEKELGEDSLPEIELFDQARQSMRSGAQFWHPTGALWWRGEGSGHAYDAFVDKVLPRFHGSADLVLTWEGGDHFEGLRLKDGKVTKHEVVMSLGAEK